MIVVSLDDFLGRYILGGDGPNGGHALHRTRQLHDPRGVLAYIVKQRTYAIRTCSEPGAVVATHGGIIVGAVTCDSLWVEPDHRGQGVAIEMYVQRWLLIGGEQWVSERAKKTVLTPGGRRSLGAAYRELVGRGIISTE